MSLADLRAKRAEAHAKAESVTEIAVSEGRDLSEAEETIFRQYMGAIEACDANIARLEKLMASKAAQAAPVLPPPGAAYAAEEASPFRLPAEAREVETPEQKANLVGAMAVALAQSKGSARDAIHRLETQGTDRAQRLIKALNSATPSAGAVTVPGELAEGVIELLRPRSVVRRAGPSVVSLGHGNLTLPRLAGGASGFYIGEGGDIPKTEPSFDTITLSGKKCAALVPISNDLLRRCQSSIEAIVRDDLLRALATTSDIAFLRGAGSPTAPKGLRNWAVAGNIFAASATATLQTVTADLFKLENALAVQNVTEDGRCWFMHPRTRIFLQSLRDGNGNLVFQAELAQGRLNGYPVFTTTNLPANLGASSNQSEILFAAMPDVLLGEEASLTLDVSTEASYTVGASTTNAFQRDETVMRAIMLHDLAVRHDQSVAALTGVSWTV